MAIQWLCPRGRVFRNNTGGGGSSGYFHVAGLSGLSSDTGAVHITGLPSTTEDISGLLATLDGGKTLYSFGTAFGSLSINGRILLGDCLQGDNGMASQVTAWFNQNRLSAGGKAVSASAGSVGAGLKLYPLSLRMGEPNESNHVQPFSITCIVVEGGGGGGGGGYSLGGPSFSLGDVSADFSLNVK